MIRQMAVTGVVRAVVKIHVQVPVLTHVLEDPNRLNLDVLLVPKIVQVIAVIHAPVLVQNLDAILVKTAVLIVVLTHAMVCVQETVGQIVEMIVMLDAMEFHLKLFTHHLDHTKADFHGKKQSYFKTGILQERSESYSSHIGNNCFAELFVELR